MNAGGWPRLDGVQLRRRRLLLHRNRFDSLARALLDEPELALEDFDRVLVTQPARRDLIGEQARLPDGLAEGSRRLPVDFNEVLAELWVLSVPREPIRLSERRLEDRKPWPLTSTSSSVTGRTASLTMPTPT